MLDVVTGALERDRKRCSKEKFGSDAGSLTRREREIMALVTHGFMNKQVAAGSA